MIPREDDAVLDALLPAFAFTLHGFHTDNGSEFVNREVAALPRRCASTFTKSRARRRTDNALVEGKNRRDALRHLRREAGRRARLPEGLPHGR